MNKKFVTLSITILLLTLLAFNTQPALSTSTMDFSQTSTPLNSPKNSEVINNSTIPNASLNLIQTFEEQQLFWDFLTDVVGLNKDNYNVDYFHAIPNDVVGSSKAQTSISAILSNDKATLNIAMVIVEGKIRSYDLSLASGTPEGESADGTDYLVASKNVINQYKTIFKADYCTNLAQLIPTTVQTDKVSVDSEKLLLTVERVTEENNQGRYAEFCWYQKIGDFTTPALSVQATFSDTGLLTSFADNMGVYKLATTQIALTEKDAIELSTPLINVYAEENGRTVESIEAEFTYVSDYYSNRGDNYLVYPQWTVSATFDNTSKENIDGYSVLIWGDSGEIHSHGAQGNYQQLQNSIANSFSSQQYALISIVAIAVTSISILTFKRTKHPNLKFKYLTFKAGGILLAVSLCTLIVAQPVSAAPASILGSQNAINQTELNCVTNFTNDLNNWCSGVGYTAYNWYGASTTATNIYTAARDHGNPGSMVFYIGHGDNRLSSGEYSISDNNGNWVTAPNILSQTPQNHKKVVTLWSCFQGDTINQMPNAWLRNTAISSNGYTSPDYSQQAFIGWTGESPFLTKDFIVGDDGDAFLRQFYINALYRGFDLRNSLNFAAQTVWQVNFENSIFYRGTTGIGHMVVYGQGTMYIGYVAYATSIHNYAYGYTGAGFINNRNDLLGSQLDGKFAELHAGNLNDYAFVVTELNRQASGTVHLQAYSGTGYYTHVIVRVSNNGNIWNTIADGYLNVNTPVDVICGSAINFRYVGVSVIDDIGWSASLFVDGIHVTV